MTEESQSPATGSQVPAPEAPPTDTQAATTPPAPTGTTAPTVTAPSSAELDVETLLSRQDVLDRLLQSEKVKKEIEYRGKTVREADRQREIQTVLAQERQRWEAETQTRAQREAATQQEAELRRMIEDDPTHPLATKLREQLAESERARITAIEQERLQAQFNEARKALHAQAGAYWVGEIEEVAKTLLGDEAGKVDRMDPKYDRPLKYLLDVFDAAKARAVEKELKARLPHEVEAAVQQRLGTDREKQASPASLPQGNAGMSGEDFIRASNRGQITDEKRARQLLQELGLSV